MARTHHASGTEPSQRMLRVAELIRHAMSELLSRGEILDPVLEKNVVTVPSVRMSPDLKLATIYVMPLGGLDKEAVVEALDRNKKSLRTEIAHRVNLKFAPELRFRHDEGFDASARIDAILNSPKVKQDLGRDEDHEE
ncbi:MAG: 30S ribosome-binding factor RbfA [Planctomycetota bacterium]